MAQVVYVLCAATSAVCAVLLILGYRRSRTRLLLWSSVGFIGLATNNALLVVDRVFATDVDLSTWRVAPAVAGLAALVYGLVWEEP